jgi:hypothetical protein
VNVDGMAWVTLRTWCKVTAPFSLHHSPGTCRGEVGDFEHVECGACLVDVEVVRSMFARRWKEVKKHAQVFRVSVALHRSCGHQRGAEMVENAPPSVGTLDQHVFGICTSVLWPRKKNILHKSLHKFPCGLAQCLPSS